MTNPKIQMPKISLRWLLVAAFGLVLLAELYLAYFHLYSHILGPKAEPPLGNVVRVNLQSYENTVEYLEELHEFQAQPLNLPRANPFQ